MGPISIGIMVTLGLAGIMIVTKADVSSEEKKAKEIKKEASMLAYVVEFLKKKEGS